MRPLRGKYLLRPHAVECMHGDLYLPDDVSASRDTALKAEVIGLPPDTIYFLGETVLYNKFAVVEIEDGVLLARAQDILGIIPAPGLNPAYRQDLFVVRPLALFGGQTAGGILLTEAYQRIRNEGLDPDELSFYHYGVGRVTHACHAEIQAGAWVVFAYAHAIYCAERDHGSEVAVDHVILRCADAPILVEVDAETIRECFPDEVP